MKKTSIKMYNKRLSVSVCLSVCLSDPLSLSRSFRAAEDRRRNALHPTDL